MIEIFSRGRPTGLLLVILRVVQHNLAEAPFYSLWRELTTHNLYDKTL
jgi:hypothetical protein